MTRDTMDTPRPGRSAAPRPRSWSGPGTALLLLTILAAHGRGLTSAFTLDDYPFLLDNPAVRTFSEPWQLFTDARTHTGGEIVRTYRPLRTLLFRIEYSLFGVRPLPWHLVNLILHATVTLLAWRFLARRLPEGPALLAAALAAAHPLGTEVVQSVKGQEDLLVAVLALVALRSLPEPDSGSPAWSRGRVARLAGVVAVALFVKESAAAIPLLMAVRLVPAWRNASPRFRRGSLALGAGITVLALAWFLVRHAALARAPAPGLRPDELPHLFTTSIANIPRYMRLFLWPAGLTVDYSRLAPVAPGSITFLLSLLLQAALLAGAWRSGHAVVRGGLAGFYLALLPFLNIVPEGVVFAERFAYLPLWGLSAALVAAGATGLSAARLHRVRRLAFPLSALLPGALCIVSFLRAGDWRDNESLFRAALKVDPESSLARTALARELLSLDRVDEATALLAGSPVSAGLALSSATESRRMALLGAGLLKRGEYEPAAAALQIVTAGRWAAGADWLNYGTALVSLRRYAQAESAFGRALRQRPDDAAALRMLGRAALEQDRFAGAVGYFDRACSIEPDHLTGWYFSVLAHFGAGGDTAACRRLAEAHRRGIRIAALVRQDSLAWQSAGPFWRECLQQEEGGP